MTVGLAELLLLLLGLAALGAMVSFLVVSIGMTRNNRRTTTSPTTLRTTPAFGHLAAHRHGHGRH